MSQGRISDQSLLDWGRGLLEQALVDPVTFDISWLREREWRVSIVADMLDEEIVQRLVAKCEDSGLNKLFAFSSGKNLIGFEFDATLSDFENFQDVTALSSYLVVPEDVSFAVISEGSYFSLLASNVEQLQGFLGGETKRWSDEFLAYANVQLRSESCRAYLKSVITTYSSGQVLIDFVSG